MDALSRDATLLVFPPRQSSSTATICRSRQTHSSIICCWAMRCEILPDEMPVLRAAIRLLWQKQRAYRFSGNTLGHRRDLHGSVARYWRKHSAAGFQKLALYNTHGGNDSLVDVMARDLRAEFGLRTFALHGSGGIAFEGLSPTGAAYGFHAGEVETAFLLAALPEFVDHSGIHRRITSRTSRNPEMLLPENAAGHIRLAHPRYRGERRNG